MDHNLVNSVNMHNVLQYIIPGKLLHEVYTDHPPPSLASGLAPLLSPEQSFTCFCIAISNRCWHKMAYLSIASMMNSFYVNRIWLILRKYINTVDSFKSFPSRQSTPLVHQRILIETNTSLEET